MYNFAITNACKKDFKKLSRDVQKFIRHSCFPIILQNPFVGEKLKGKNLQGFLKFGIKFQSTDYRIIYEIQNEKLTIIFIIIASRENFYKKLNRRI
ncbi:type II toxin-antitoxin system RelE/ParE family toxin [Patescibacteria group bacterium]|nr:type II toxin-antitoxin system RelE/ParE family toxin [Patescibacteria group bacterium]MBU1420960.1 type II toxin-antitoxin system RelE/ParE family toxin [Patescibacteria group bacterium]